MGDDIRSLIREVLAEELKTFRTANNDRAADVAQSKDRVETISIAGDADLNEFAKRVLELAGNEEARSDIRTGKMRFQLANSQTHGQIAHAEPVQTIQFEKGLISEKKIADLPDGATIKATKAVCFTPLALDEIRRKRISVERMKK